MPNKKKKNPNLETPILLVKVAAIVNFVIAGFVFLGGLIAFIGLSLYRTMPINLGVFGIFIAILILIFGFFFWRLHELMSDEKTAKNASIWTIVLGAISISSVSGILALIGGIFALIELDKKQ